MIRTSVTRRSRYRLLLALGTMGALAFGFACRFGPPSRAHLLHREIEIQGVEGDRFGGRARGYADTSLAALAERSGRYFGAAVASRHLRTDPSYARLVAREVDIVVPEWEMKWSALRPAPDSFDFRGADAIVGFAESHHMSVRGHNLVWHDDIPQWFARTATPANADSILATHIRAVVGRYRGRVRSWDVVNEPIELDDGRRDGLRAAPWLRLLGPGYIARAFRLAHAADPAAQLVLNEAGLEYDTERSSRRRHALLSLLRQLVDEGVPIHALGVEGHLRPPARFNPVFFAAFLDSVSALGLKIVVTELDVTDRAYPADIGTRDSLVAGAYQSFLDVALANPAVEGVLTWGLSDKYSWIRRYYPRSDQRPTRPAPFDTAFQRKLAWYAIAGAFERAHLRSQR